jgi:hypothetical protein
VSASTGHGFLKARNGAVFGAELTTESDGSLVILSNDGKGYRSAHRDHAQKHFGQALWCVSRLSWVNVHGVRVVLTRWNTQEFRTALAPGVTRSAATGNMI